MKFANSIALCSLILIFNCACKDNSKPVVSFDPGDYTEMSEGALPEIVDSNGPAVILSEPAPSDISVNISVTGGNAVYGDDFTYSKPVVILKGDKVRSIGLQFVNDYIEELDDTVQLTISSVADDKAMVNSKPTHVIIKNDDVADLEISVQWGIIYNSRIDLYLWRETSPGNNSFEIIQKSEGRADGYVGLQLFGLEKDGLYGLSYVYHSGTADPLHFLISFQQLGSSTLEGTSLSSPYHLDFDVDYSQSNLNAGSPTTIEQYFTKKGFVFKNVTTVTVPKSGS